MSRNGSGVYSLPAGNPVVTGTTISSTWANSTLSDIATALTQSIAYDGQTTPIANLPMGGYIHTGVGNATARTNYASAAQVEDGTLNYLTSVSGTNTITATAPISMSAYVAGQTFRFIAAGANTGAVTLNLNSIGAKSLVRTDGSALVSGDIASGAAVQVFYDGTNFQLLSDANGKTETVTNLTVTGNLTNSALTSGRVTYATTGGLLTDSANMTFNGTTFTLANDASINGLTVGKGGGAVSTNTALGVSALASNSSGNQSVAVGYGSLGSSAGGTNNVAVGYNAGNAYTGSYGTFVGMNAGTSTTGVGNNAFGATALGANTTGASNSAFGGYDGTASAALRANTSGSYNSAFGVGALASNTTASYNTAVGYQSLYANTTGQFNVAIGRNALIANTTADENTAVGTSSLTSNTTGAQNVAIGRLALNGNTTGNYNVSVGKESLLNNTTASNNTAVGYQAGYSNSTGASNTFVGYQAGYSSNYNGAAYNTIVGYQAGYNLTTGIGNTFVGSVNGAGYYVTTGSKNTILGGYNGNQGGLDIRTLSNNIVLSDGDGNPFVFWSNTTYGIRYDWSYNNSGTVSYLPSASRSSTDGGGGGIASSLYGDVPTTGFLHVVETGTANYYIGAIYKRGTSYGTTVTTIASSGLSVSAVNSGGTIAMTGYTTGANVKMRTVIYAVSYGL